MKNSKKRGAFVLGRKFAFTLALFLLVFAAASIVKIQAAGNTAGWLWGGSEETSDGTINGNESGVGWISMSGTNYGVTIPTDNTAVTGYAWANASDVPNSSVSHEENGLGWIQFDPAPDNARYPGCGYPAAPCNGVMRNDDNLEGWARFVSIKDALAANNSGGWEGWIKMRGPNYGVQISKMLGVGSGSHTYAWSNELGAIDFGQAQAPCTVPINGSCGNALSQTYCSGGKTPSDYQLCSSTYGNSAVSGDGSAGNPWKWTCFKGNSCGTDDDSCTATYSSPQDGQCGTADGGSFCQGRTPTNAEMCTGGTHPAPSSLDLNLYEVKWTCSGVCSSVNDDCSAKGKKACGWIETNP